MELIKVGKNTYYIKNNTNIGIYKINDTDIFLIDTGNDKDAGKKILKIINENSWVIKGIICTHSHADHIGGNKIIQDKTGCLIIANGIEVAFTEYPILESSFLYGGFSFKDLKNKFLMAKESNVTKIDNNLPENLEYFNLKGHFFDMIGIKTIDDVYFLGDSLFSEDTINKYHIIFIYDVKEYLNTLDFLSTLKGKLFIISHGEALENISSLIELNRNKIFEICDKICNICKNKITFEDILDNIFKEYNLVMNLNQYFLVGSTIKSYLSYLYNENRLSYEFINNKMFWKSI